MGKLFQAPIALGLMSFFLLGVAAHAADTNPQVESGVTILCDTQKQMERLASLMDKDAAIAINLVNAEEHNPNACGLAQVAYLRGPSFGMARNNDGTFQIVKILVIGIDTPQGVRPTKPSAYFSLLKIEDVGA